MTTDSQAGKLDEEVPSTARKRSGRLVWPTDSWNYVRVFSDDYSVDPSFIGRIVDVIADLDTIWVTHEGVIIATHVRAWARHLVLTDPAHVARAAVMRRDFRTQRVHSSEPEEAVQVRDPAAYDEIFGIDLGLQPAILEVAS